MYPNRLPQQVLLAADDMLSARILCLCSLQCKLAWWEPASSVCFLKFQGSRAA